MNTRTEIREIENHLHNITSDKNEQLAIISKAQAMVTDYDHYMDVLCIVKRRIITGEK